MNTLPISSSWKIRLLILIGVSWLGTWASSQAVAAPDNEGNAAVAAARSWVTLIDAGNYEGSYASGCFQFHEKVPEVQWVEVLRTLRKPLGLAVSRKEVGHVYRDNGLNGLDGECMIVTFETSFEKLDNATEVIVLKKESGKWLGAGYNFGPKQTEADADADQPPPLPQTQVDTTTTHGPPK